MKIGIYSHFRSIIFVTNLHPFVFRANRSSYPSTPSNTPISLTQSLSELRLIHARLSEDHGSTGALLLRQREAEIAELDRKQVKA